MVESNDAEKSTLLSDLGPTQGDMRRREGEGEAKKGVRGRGGGREGGMEGERGGEGERGKSRKNQSSLL